MKKLSPEELKEVAGGGCNELYDDSNFLAGLGFGKAYLYIDLAFNPQYCNNVVKTWASVGVQCKYNDFLNNEYFIDGKKVSRQQAYEQARKFKAANQ